MNELPNWDECKDAVNNDEATALQNFIYEQEPAGNVASNAFRSQLLALINE